MFSFFKKKVPYQTAADKIAMDTASKFSFLYALWEKDKQLIIICWFDDSMQQLQDYFSKRTPEQATLIMAREISSPQAAGKPVVFAEHYPLREKEIALYEKLKLEPAIVYSSLEDPLLLQFGGERISHMMKVMGMNQGEMIEHAMISSSIQKAQKKIAGKVSFEQTTRSSTDWFQKNLAGQNL